MTVLLGCDACPLGLNVQYLEAPLDQVLYSTSGYSPFVRHHSSSGSPWFSVGAQAGPWTAVVNNFVTGGDSTAPGPAVARNLGVRCVVAQHVPRYRPRHAATQLMVQGPRGEGPLGYIRTLAAHATDGRWRWDESGVPFPFEETERYAERRKRDRFDRGMLLTYLAALGISVDDDAYRPATLLKQIVSWSPHEESLADAKAAFGL